MSRDGRRGTDGTPSHDAINSVNFASLAGQHGESSSRASSLGKRSHGSRREQRHGDKKEEVTTPPGHDRKDDDEGSGGGRGSTRHRIRKSGGFLLDSVLNNGSPPGPSDPRDKRKSRDSPLQIDKRRSTSKRVSGDSSMRSSPLSRELSFDAPTDGGNIRQRQTSRPQTVDPAQLVQMALNLSESRTRHVSNTLQVPLPAGRRVSSANHGTVRSASSGSRRASRWNDSAGRHSPASEQSGSQAEAASPVDLGQDHVLHTFSPATLARAEKARKYFELASEYRRALEHVPPLKPNAQAPGNYSIASKSSPGTTLPEITRVPTHNDEKHDLGRAYNPIQSLRNRRVRIRERRPFTAPPDTWKDPEQVSQWVDDVQQATEHADFRASGDQVVLPEYPHEDESLAYIQPGTKGHRRTDTAGSVITRPENSWTIEPTELLADLYWTEKNDNKFYIETRRGYPIFTLPPRPSIDTPKISVEMHRDHNEVKDEGTSDNESDNPYKRNKRRRLILPLNRVSRTEKRKHRRMLSRTSSESSDASADSVRARRLRKGRSSLDQDIAPLERHMQDLIAKDERGELSSPEVVSPDHWDTQYARAEKVRPSIDRINRSSIDRANGRGSLEVPRPEHRRSKSADGRMGSLDMARSSVSAHDSEPATPVDYGSSPGLDFSPPYTKSGSESGQGSKLPTFRSQSKERRGIEQTDFAENSASNLYTIFSGDSSKPRSSMESSRPHIFTRHRTNDSFDKNIQRQDSDSASALQREGGSTVGRFLKERRDRLGGLVSERFKTRDRAETLGTYEASKGASDVSDMEDAKQMNGPLKKRMTEPASAEISPRASLERGRPKPKFYLSGLPAFTSSNARDKRSQRDASDNSAQVKHQERNEAESGKSGRLTTPTMNVADSSEPEAEKFGPKGEGGRIKWAKGYGELDSRATSTSRGSAIPTSGPGSAMRQRQRHWSIYDRVQPEQTDKVSERDIARVRALLLASGIKAHEIQRRADRPRAETPQPLLDASRATGEDIHELPAMKDEHAVASRMLTAYLTAAFTSFERSIADFQTQTAKALAADTHALHGRASEQLSARVHETSDEADAFVVELTTRGPQNTKQVLDAVEEIVRRRRRQWRLLVNVAFKLLEWLLLGIMWGIWAVVVVFNLGKRTVVGVGRMVRWLVVF